MASELEKRCIVETLRSLLSGEKIGHRIAER